MKFGATALLACCGIAAFLAVQGQQLSGLPSLDAAPAGFSTAPKSVSFIDLGQPAAGFIFEIPTSDPLVAPPAGLTQYTPDQIHVTLGEAGSFWVSWATGNDSFVVNQQAPAYPTNTIYAPQTQDVKSVASEVMWGLASGSYPNKAVGYARSYVQTYLHDGYTYVSQLFHHVHVTGLPYGQAIYYKIGDTTKEMSGEFTITLSTAIQPVTFTYPMRLGVVADVGQTYNSSVTYQHLVADKPDAAVFIGDLSYSDNYNDRGGEGGIGPSTTTATYNGTSKSLSQTYQPRWETMGRLLQRSGNAVALPWIFGPGNHEIERDEYLRPFQSYMNRYRTPYEQSGSQDPMYYSVDVGPAHIIMLNGYDSILPNTTIEDGYAGLPLISRGNAGGPEFERGNYPYSAIGANQLSWLLNDLARVNRAVTPWVVVTWHQPTYNSYSTHYKEADCLRQMVEPFLYNAGVDIVMHGHVHAYERAYQTYNYQLDGCAPRWLTMGDGGNQEGLYKQFAATSCTNAACANVTANLAPYVCPTFQDGLWAPAGGAQPTYSAYREPSYGHGIIDFINSTHALWTWNRNQDSVSVTSDSVYFIRNPKCNNFKTGTPVPPPSTTPVPTSSAPPVTLPNPPPVTSPPKQGIQNVIEGVAGSLVNGVLNHP
jgi:predicted phosphodiesterase